MLAPREPHAPPSPQRRLRRLWLAGCALALTGCALAVAGCGPEAEKAAAVPTRNALSPDQIRQAFAELDLACAPIDPTWTSDVQEAAQARRRAVVAKLAAGPPELGRAALSRFQGDATASEDLRVSLLDIAASSAPQDAGIVLAELVMRYGTQTPLALRSRAARLLAAADPARALAVLEPLLREPRATTTYPPQEILLGAWIDAARAQGSVDAQLLADIATSMVQPQEARYLALEELGRIPTTPIGRAALETVLVESGFDGYLRRKAAQALAASLPKDDACAVLSRVADRETDKMFLLFLGDMLEKQQCP